MILFALLTLAFLLIPILFHNAYPDLAFSFGLINQPTTSQWIVFYLCFYRQAIISRLFFVCVLFLVLACILISVNL
jgi:hypothetical protein